MILKFRGINYSFEYCGGDISFLVIESREFYWKLLNSLNELNEDNIFLIDDKKIDLKNAILFFDRLFDLDTNSKKILSLTYQDINKMYLNDSIKVKISVANEILLGILDKLALDVDFKARYESDLTLNDVLNLYKFRYEIESKSFIEMFLQYIKSLMVVMKYKYVVTLNLLDFIDKNNLDLLSNELKILGLDLIDISRHSYKLEKYKEILIDNDLCEML